MSLHLFPSTPAATPDRLPLSRLRVQRPPVLHRPGSYITVKDAIPASITHVDAHLRTRTVAQRGQSSPCVTAVLVLGDRPTPVAITLSPARTVRAAVETLNTVTESGRTPSAPAPKAIVTFPRPWVTRHPANKGRAGLSVSTVVGSDGLIAYRVMEVAYRLTSSTTKPLLGGGALVYRRGTPTPIITRQFAGRLMSPSGVEIEVAQTETVTYRLAENARTLRRSHLRIASRDGVIDPDEAAVDAALMSLADDLEQKADDERAAIALLRTGRTKRTRGIVVDLFPSIGPEAA